MASEIRNAALHFEAISIGLRKSNAGDVLTLRIHHGEKRTALWDHPLGSRYTVALVRMVDDEQPDTSSQPPAPPAPAGHAVEKAPAPKRALKDCPLAMRAGMLCDSDVAFWNFLARRSGRPIRVNDGEHAANLLRAMLDVKSRAEFDTDPEAGKRFLALEREFKIATGRIRA